MTVVTRNHKPPTIQWVVVSVGLGLVAFLAVVGTLRNEFDYTYVALTTLGLVGLVVRSATDKAGDDDDAS